MQRRLWTAASRSAGRVGASGSRLRRPMLNATPRNATSGGDGGRIKFDPASVSAAARSKANVARDAFRDWNLPGASRDELLRIMNETLTMRSRRLAIAFGVGTCTLGGVLWVYRHETKKAVAEELSDVASRSLGDQKMQAEAAKVTIQTLQALLTHDETVQRSVTFLSQVAEHEQTKTALVGLLVTALQSPSVLQEALSLTLWVLDDARSREHLVSALVTALQNERFLAAAAQFAVKWLGDEDVRQTIATALKESSLQVLEDATVHYEAEKFVKQLLLEPQLQAKTSEHLWAAVKGLVYTPRRKDTPQPAVGTTVAKAKRRQQQQEQAVAVQQQPQPQPPQKEAEPSPQPQPEQQAQQQQPAAAGEPSDEQQQQQQQQQQPGADSQGATKAPPAEAEEEVDPRLRNWPPTAPVQGGASSATGAAGVAATA